MEQTMDQFLLPVGTVLQGRYRIEKKLSSGGFGITYKAVDMYFDDEPVAIKEFFLKDDCLRDSNTMMVSVTTSQKQAVFDEQKKKFQKEAIRMRKLRHPNIVEVKDRFDENGTVYYVMEFIDGLSLRDLLLQKRALDEQLARQCLDQVLAALEAVHREGIFHLDIKPANIMVSTEADGSLRVHLIDFGASKQQKVEGGATSTSALCYTPGYAPVEQKDQRPDKFGPWTDFYALGATLYNVLTGLTPPDSTDIMDMGKQAFHFPSTVSEQMQQLIIWMMNYDRNRRPKSVEEIHDKMHQLVEPPKRIQESPKRLQKVEIVQNPPVDNEETVVEEAPQKEKPPTAEKHKQSGRLWPTKYIVGAAVTGALVLAIIVVSLTISKNNDTRASLPFDSSFCPDGSHPHVIDLGLPSGTKWACCNVGASLKFEGYGDMFTWGETSKNSDYEWNSYRWCDGSETSLTKYNTNSSYGIVDNRTQLELDDDAAHANWHGSWRMPTIAEFQELIDNCDYEWTTVNGVKGGKFTSRSNGRSIFLPAAGWRNGTSLYCRGEYGLYWSSSLNESYPNVARYLSFGSGGARTDYYGRLIGQGVRPVLRN